MEAKRWFKSIVTTGLTNSTGISGCSTSTLVVEVYFLGRTKVAMYPRDASTTKENGVIHQYLRNTRFTSAIAISPFLTIVLVPHSAVTIKWLSREKPKHIDRPLPYRHASEICKGPSILPLRAEKGIEILKVLCSVSYRVWRDMDSEPGASFHERGSVQGRKDFPLFPKFLPSRTRSGF